MPASIHRSRRLQSEAAPAPPAGADLRPVAAGRSRWSPPQQRTLPSAAPATRPGVDCCQPTTIPTVILVTVPECRARKWAAGHVEPADRHPQREEARTATSPRQLALDPFTTAALEAHRVRQLKERPAWGPAWVDTGLVFTREDGQVMHPEHVTKRFAAGAGRRPAADHPARRAPQLCDRGAGGRRAAHGRVRAARACQQLDHRQPLPARAAVDGRAHRQRRRQPVGAAVGARDRLQAGPGGEAQRPGGAHPAPLPHASPRRRWRRASLHVRVAVMGYRFGEMGGSAGRTPRYSSLSCGSVSSSGAGPETCTLPRSGTQPTVLQRVAAEQYVLGHGHLAEDAVSLQHVRESGGEQLLRPLTGDVPVVEENPARPRRQEAAGDLEDRGLAGAQVLRDQGPDRPAGHGKGDLCRRLRCRWEPPGSPERGAPRTWQRSRCRCRSAR
jgi:hypothetical protein